MTRRSSVAIDTSANSDGSSGVCVLTMARGRRGCGGFVLVDAVHGRWVQSGVVVAAGRAEKAMQSWSTGAAVVTGFFEVSTSWWLRSGVSSGGRTGSWRPWGMPTAGEWWRGRRRLGLGFWWREREWWGGVFCLVIWVSGELMRWQIVSGYCIKWGIATWRNLVD